MNSKVTITITAVVIMLFVIYRFFIKDKIGGNPDLPKEDASETVESLDAQTTEPIVTGSTHLAFKGIPIDGTLSDFTKKLKHNGFFSTGMEGNEATMRGMFGSYNKCKISIRTNKYTGNTCLVKVFFPDCYDWEEIYSSYTQLKELLTERYGQHTECVEEFHTMLYRPDEDDLSKMQCLRFDECNYKTEWHLENGIIVLKMDHDGILHCFLTLTYIDSENYETTESEFLYDL